MSAREKLQDNVSFYNQHPEGGDVRAELLAGLQARARSINPKFFYDAEGSRLFERITELPEYYPTRTERGILQQEAPAISARCGAGCVLVEPGAGSCEKVRLLLDSLQPAAYVPMDISAEFLRAAALRLGAEWPDLQIHAICADFGQQWQLPPATPAGRRVAFYPGSTIGNLEPSQARAFLERLRGWVGADGGVLIGVDMHKDSATLEAAYDDSQGITAAFNRNLLNHVNRVLEADFNPQNFAHRAFYNRELQRIEMHLVSREEQVVKLGSEHIHLRESESLHTENSYKYTAASFAELSASAGLQVSERWHDADELFSVFYLEPVPAQVR